MAASLIGNIPVRLRDDNIADHEIREMLDAKERYGCKTEIELIKKSLLYYKNTMEKSPRHEEILKNTGNERSDKPVYMGSLYD